jgi:hypothetical protein
MNDLPFERLRSVPGRKDGEDYAGGFGSGDKSGRVFWGGRCGGPARGSRRQRKRQRYMRVTAMGVRYAGEIQRK